MFQRKSFQDLDQTLRQAGEAGMLSANVLKRDYTLFPFPSREKPPGVLPVFLRQHTQTN